MRICLHTHMACSSGGRGGYIGVSTAADGCFRTRFADLFSHLLRSWIFQPQASDLSVPTCLHGISCDIILQFQTPSITVPDPVGSDLWRYRQIFLVSNYCCCAFSPILSELKPFQHSDPLASGRPKSGKAVRVVVLFCLAGVLSVHQNKRALCGAPCISSVVGCSCCLPCGISVLWL